MDDQPLDSSYRWGLLDSTVGRDSAFWALSLAALTGLFMVNSNPTYTVTYFPVFAAVLIARWRDLYRNWHWWALAAILATIIILPTVVYLLQEMSRFVPTALRYRYPEAPALTNIFDLLVRPLSLPNEPWQEFAIRRGTRIVFFGGPFVLLCLYYLSGVWRRTARLDLTLPLVVSVAILTIEAIPTPLVSARFQYRDPLILFAVLMAGSVLDDLWRSRPRMATSVAAIQCIIIISAAWPFIGKALQPESQIWDRRATGQTGLAQDLATLVGQDRIILSRDVDQAYTKKELLPDGLSHNSLAYRGVSLVNGKFKGSSTETVYPSPQLAYG